MPSSTGFVNSPTALAAAYNKVFVAGGSRGVGRCIVDKLLENGSQVVTLVRDEADRRVKALVLDDLTTRGEGAYRHSEGPVGHHRPLQVGLADP